MINPCFFAPEPLDRASVARTSQDFISDKLADEGSSLILLHRGDPLFAGDKPAFLSAAARQEISAQAPTVFLGTKAGRAYFAVDVSAAPTPDQAPFADFGGYVPLREVAGTTDVEDLAIIGQARWLLDWHSRHQFCARCGAPTKMVDGGTKRLCDVCETEHFPRSDPVAIVLAIHGDDCLLGRGPHFPPGFLSALAGFVEAAETPEECAVRELREEAGVTIRNVQYLFSQPWPFPSSMMMGFIAQADDRKLVLDKTEIEEACWVPKSHVARMLTGEIVDGIGAPPAFTIAHQIMRYWVENT